MATSEHITRHGPLCYAQCEEYTNKGTKPYTIGPNTFLHKDGDAYCVVLYRTTIITFHKDGRVILNSGGYKTPTTKGRMAALTGMPIYSKNHTWYVGQLKFFDGINVGANPSK